MRFRDGILHEFSIQNFRKLFGAVRTQMDGIREVIDGEARIVQVIAIDHFWMSCQEFAQVSCVPLEDCIRQQFQITIACGRVNQN